VPWSIFSDGGGSGAAFTWAKDLLTKLGAPLSAGNEQFIYDWEVSEGGGGKYNPLNQGPVPGKPKLTTTGQQFGGGAADFASWDAGLTGAADYLHMPAYAGILSGLKGNHPEAARSALIASPWAKSHYGGGAGFSNKALPGKASALAPGGGGVSATAGGGSTSSGLFGIAGALGSLGSTFKAAAFIAPIVIAGGALVVVGAAKATGLGAKAKQAAGTVAKAAPAAAVL
jgi:hypothetical protein